MIQKRSRLLSSHLSKQKIQVVIHQEVEPDADLFVTKVQKQVERFEDKFDDSGRLEAFNKLLGADIDRANFEIQN